MNRHALGFVLVLGALAGLDAAAEESRIKRPPAAEAPTGNSARTEHPNASAPLASEASPGQLDWCARVAVRPMRRMRSMTECVPYLTPQEVARGADLVLMGSQFDVAATESPKTGSCGGPFSHENNRDYIAEVRRQRRLEQPMRFVHMSRFELVGSRQTELPGFDPGFLLRRAPGAPDPSRFFAEDRSPHCRHRSCRWDFRRWETRQNGITLSDSLGRLPGGSPSTAVFYLSRPARDEEAFGPVAALADLGNEDYRAWRVELARRAIERGGYDAVMHSHKFGQYFHSGFWLGSDRYPTVTAYVESKDSVWSAAPRDYGYAEYVAGWSALAADLRRAGVPFAVSLQPNPWLRTADDPKTGQDERSLILAAVQSASLVILDVANAHGHAAEGWEALVGAKGAEVFRVDSSCGFARGEVW